VVFAEEFCLYLACRQPDLPAIVVLQHPLPANRHGFLVAELPITHLFELIVGICAAIRFDELRSREGAYHSRGVALISVALVATVDLAFLRPVSPACYLGSPVFAALELGLLLLERPVIGFLNQRWLVRLGEASYSFYLIHVPLAHLAFIAGSGNRMDGSRCSLPYA
jgi:peptidoglycan/LPS O-acetylase OafA/YrhL